MLKHVLSVCCLLLATVPGYSQWQIGAEGGITRNELYTRTAYLTHVRYVPESGFQLGIPVRYELTDWAAIRTGLELTEKNYRQERTGFLDGLYQLTKNRYLTLPLGAEFSFGVKRWRGYCGFGGYAAYWMNSRIQGQGTSPFYSAGESPGDEEEVNNLAQLNPTYSFHEKYIFDDRKDRRWEAGWTASAGIRYELRPCQLFLQVQYRHSLTDQQKDYMLQQTPRYNQTSLLSTGVLFHLSSHH